MVDKYAQAEGKGLGKSESLSQCDRLRWPISGLVSTLSVTKNLRCPSCTNSEGCVRVDFRTGLSNEVAGTTVHRIVRENHGTSSANAESDGGAPARGRRSQSIGVWPWREI